MRPLLLSLILSPLIACNPLAPTAVDAAGVKAMVDPLLGVPPLELRGLLKGEALGSETALLSLDVAPGGGMRGSLRHEGLLFLSFSEKSGDWKIITERLFEARRLAVPLKDGAEVDRLLRSEHRADRVAAAARLTLAERASYRYLVNMLGDQPSPASIRQLTAQLLGTDTKNSTLSLITLAQRYPGLLDELLGAVAERPGELARAYLTAVALGHADPAARETAQASLEARP